MDTVARDGSRRRNPAHKQPTLLRRDVVRSLVSERGDLLVVAGLGSSSYDLRASGDHDRNFYLWGAMGGAAMLGVGLALARPNDHVAVLTGDGEQLMGLGALATIGALSMKNLTIVVLDNLHYGETGMQPSHTAMGVDLPGVAAACRFAWTLAVDDEAGVEEVRLRLRAGEGPGFASVLVRAEEPERTLPPRDGVELKNRFRRQLGMEPI